MRILDELAIRGFSGGGDSDFDFRFSVFSVRCSVFGKSRHDCGLETCPLYRVGRDELKNVFSSKPREP